MYYKQIHCLSYKEVINLNKADLKEMVRVTLRGTIPALAETEFNHIYDDNGFYSKTGWVDLSEEDIEYIKNYAVKLCQKAVNSI